MEGIFSICCRCKLIENPRKVFHLRRLSLTILRCPSKGVLTLQTLSLSWLLLSFYYLPFSLSCLYVCISVCLLICHDCLSLLQYALLFCKCLVLSCLSVCLSLSDTFSISASIWKRVSFSVFHKAPAIFSHLFCFIWEGPKKKKKKRKLLSEELGTF